MEPVNTESRACRAGEKAAWLYIAPLMLLPPFAFLAGLCLLINVVETEGNAQGEQRSPKP